MPVIENGGMEGKLCLIFNAAPRYREAIYRAIDSEYDCDWYFGRLDNGIAEMDTSTLNRVEYYDALGNTQGLYWQCGIIPLLFRRRYRTFLMTAEVRSISFWIFSLFAFLCFPRKKVYLWTHGWYGKEQGLVAAMKLWLYRHAAGVFLYGNHAKKMLTGLGIPEDRLFVVHNSLHYDRQRVLRESLRRSYIYEEHFGNDLPTLLFIGRLTKVKKLDQIISALELLRRRGENYNLVFVGDGVERRSLESLAREKGLSDSVWFYGACYDEKSNAELIYNADLCVSPGNVGLTAMHALVFGCPVITHNCFRWQMPEFEAVRPGETGDFFGMDDVDDLAHVISGWFAEKGALREIVRQKCFEEIDTGWNPKFQMDIFRENLRLNDI